MEVSVKERKEIALRVIPEPLPNTRSVLILGGQGTVVMKGLDESNPDLCCGNCAATLVSGTPEKTIHNVVFKCNGCGTYNET